MDCKDKALIQRDCFEMVHKIEIKEEPRWAGNTSTEVKVQSEEFSCFINKKAVVSKGNPAYETGNKIQIKEEPLWLEEMKCHSEETLPVSHFTLLNAIKKRFAQIKSKSKEVANLPQLTLKDVAVESIPRTESLRCTQAPNSIDSSECERSNVSEGSGIVTNALAKKKLPHKCVRCGRGYLHSSQLERHRLIHEQKIPCICEICGKSFTQYSYLNQHYLIHEGKGLYRCEICQKSFTKLSNLKAHNVIHGGIRPHKCVLCKQSFTHVYALKRHMLFHEGKRPHGCSVCKKSFVQLSDLNRHMLIHEGKKPFKCDICEKSFNQRSSLKSHKRVHRDEKT